MPRAVSNLLIVLVMATTATAVLAFSSNTADVEDPGSSDAEIASGDAQPEIESESADVVTSQSVEQADDTGEQTSAEARSERAGADPAEPSTEPDVQGAVQSAQEVESAEISQAQETQTPETLPETGPVEIGQWLVIAAAALATGGLARNAGRDHEAGVLTVLP